MKIDIVDLNRFIQVNECPKVDNPVFFNSSRQPTASGDFSYELFGISGSYNRKTVFGYVVSALSTANPSLMPLAVGGLVYSLYKSENKIVTLKQAGKGAIISGGALAASALIGGPVWLGCITAIGAAVAIRYLMDHPDKAFERMNQLLKPASSLYRKVSIHLM